MPEDSKKTIKPLSRREARLAAGRVNHTAAKKSASRPQAPRKKRALLFDDDLIEAEERAKAKRRSPSPASGARKKVAGTAARAPKEGEAGITASSSERASAKNRVPKKNAKKRAPGPQNGRHVARRVGQATLAGMKRFNAFSYSQRGGEKRMFRIPLTFRFFIIASLIIIFAMILALNNQSINVDQQTVAIAGLPSALENYRILHISDLHAAEFGTEQSTLLRTVNGLSYDILLITGDMVGASGNAEPFLSFLRGLSTRSNVYFIAGDSDPGPLLSRLRDGQGTLDQLVLEDWILDAVELGATYLDSPISLSIGNDGTKLWLSPFSQLGISAKSAVASYEEQLNSELTGYLSGIGADYINYPFTDYRYRQAQSLFSAVSEMSASDVHISLAHVPPMDSLLSVVQDDHSDTANEYLCSPDLVLAGHYCGGVFRLPGYGALYIPDALQGNHHGWFPDQSRVRGQISVGSTTMYVTGGLGVTDAVKFPFRLFNTPEVSLITLTGLLTDNMLIN